MPRKCYVIFRLQAEGRSEGTREWVVRGYPYILVYEVGFATPETIMILGVFHGAQDRSPDEPV